MMPSAAADPGVAGLPPGPRAPSAAQAMLWALRPLDLLDRSAARYGELFTLRIRRGRPWVVTTSPTHAKEVFTRAPELMGAGAGEANPLLGPLLGPTSVMLRDEPVHLDERKHLLPSFHGSRMQGYGEMIVEVAEREVAGWPMGEPFALWPQMQAISLEVVMRAVFGRTDGERMAAIRRGVVELTSWINNPRRLAMLAAFGSRTVTGSRGFNSVMRPLEQHVLEEVRQRTRDGELGEDIMSMLVRAYGHEDTAASELKLRDELITMISDGPTATSLSWVFERLLRHPEKFERLREEQFGGAGEEYLDAVVTETLRLCPTVPLVMRRLIEPMRVGEYTIPADTIVAPCVYLMHRRGDLYRNPLEFLPERFLDASAGTYTWIPFGGGVRRCVAASFAPLEMRRVIQTVIREIELRPAVTGSESPTRSSVSFAPGDGALVIANRRRPSRV
jgi:cytochrome P450